MKVTRVSKTIPTKGYHHDFPNMTNFDWHHDLKKMLLMNSSGTSTIFKFLETFWQTILKVSGEWEILGQIFNSLGSNTCHIRHPIGLHSAIWGPPEQFPGKGSRRCSIYFRVVATAGAFQEEWLCVEVRVCLTDHLDQAFQCPPYQTAAYSRRRGSLVPMP